MRPTKDEYFLSLAMITSTRATCTRRKVGAVAVDENGYVISTGYNGLPKSMMHCIDSPCLGASSAKGENLDMCMSIHAEQNLIAHCSNPQNLHTLYITATPCMSCMKLIIATGCRMIVATEIYSVESVTFFGDVGGEVLIKSLK